MVFGKNKESQPEMEVIEEELQAAEEELGELQQDREIVDEESNQVVDKKEDVVKIVVVRELPMEPVRFTTLQDGTNVQFITTEEALSKIINS